MLFTCVINVTYGQEGNRKITVAQDGTGDFKTINEAIASAKSAALPAKPIDIIVRPGTYAETIRTANWVNLIGENRETCIIRTEGGAVDTVNQHTISATSNTILKNLTLVGLEVKYVIHSDGGKDYVLTIENCTLRREYPNKNSRNYPAAFGIGLRGGQHIVMKNCLLEAILPVYWHNWDNQTKSSSMTLEKCAFKGEDYAIGIYNLGSGQHDYFVLHDCTLTGAKDAVKYINQKSVKGNSWNGQDETELIGSGNTFAGPCGKKIKDDSQNRLSGLELSGVPATALPLNNLGDWKP